MKDLEIGVPGQIMPPAHRAVELGQRAEADGYDALWWPCHLMGWHPDSIWTPDMSPLAAAQPSGHVYFDPLVMMGAVGAQTNTIKVGSVVTDLIRRHPAMVANMALTVDHLTQGRSILGLGSGERMNVTPYGMGFDRPVGRLEEGIEIIRALWAADGPINYDGKFHQLKDAVLGLSPYGDTPPPIWTAAHGPRMLNITGRLADGWLPTKLAPEVYADSLATIRQASVDAGRSAEAVTPGLLAYVLAAPDEATLRRMQEAPLLRAIMVMLPPQIFRELGVEPPEGFHELIPASVPRAAGRGHHRRHSAQGGRLLLLLRHPRADRRRGTHLLRRRSAPPDHVERHRLRRPRAGRMVVQGHAGGQGHIARQRMSPLETVKELFHLRSTPRTGTSWPRCCTRSST